MKTSSTWLEAIPQGGPLFRRQANPSRHNLLIDAIDYLLTRRIKIDICGLSGASHYEISGERMAEADLIALATKMGMGGADSAR